VILYSKAPLKAVGSCYTIFRKMCRILGSNAPRPLKESFGSFKAESLLLYPETLFFLPFKEEDIPSIS
jgi:hypothetical protein